MAATLQFYDETGINPLPAGIEVTVYVSTAQQVPANVIGVGWTKPGGLCDIENLSNAVIYVATFFGKQAPLQQAPFVGDAPGTLVAVTCDGYRSPALSIDGYANEQANFWPSGPGWFGDEAREVGGTAYALAQGNGAMLAVLDLEEQGVLSEMRLQSSEGADIDSWALDMIGPEVSRYVGVTDQQWITFIEAFLSGEKLTRAGIQGIVDAFYTCIEDELAAAYSGNLTYSGMGGYDSGGGYDVTNPFNPADVLPTVYVWDRQSRPDLANTYNVNPNNDNGDFVIQIGFNPLFPESWFLDHSHLDFETFLVDSTTFTLSATSPDPRLAVLVALYKQAGTHPLYLTYIADA